MLATLCERVQKGVAFARNFAENHVVKQKHKCEHFINESLTYVAHQNRFDELELPFVRNKLIAE